MTKGLMAGMTDYSHQTLLDIVQDLESESDQTISAVKDIEDKVHRLIQSGYWKNVLFNFRKIIDYSLNHYRNAATEMKEIASEIPTMVQEHHWKRLRRIAKVAAEINVEIGQVWHREYDEKDYDDKEFRVVEEIYAEARDTAASLLDVENMAIRLGDFAGKGLAVPPKKNNPWISGSFYLFVMVVVLAVLSAAARMISWVSLPLVFIAGIIILVLIGALQLRNDEKLKEETFLRLVVEAFKRLPLFQRKQK